MLSIIPGANGNMEICFSETLIGQLNDFHLSAIFHVFWEQFHKSKHRKMFEYNIFSYNVRLIGMTLKAVRRLLAKGKELFWRWGGGGEEVGRV